MPLRLTPIPFYNFRNYQLTTSNLHDNINQHIISIKEDIMPHYMQLVVLTDKGRKSFDEDPEWIKSINQEIEYLGGKIETQFALLGQWDFVNIIEAPSDEAAAKLAIKLSSTGCFQPLTMAALPLDGLIESLKKDPNTPW